ncbi:MAG: heat-inducible transcription repressor HrcA [Clostridia bacterium]|nr:heat-inducible transcription repressor HrcA [Clostridia bacterium]
MILEPRKAKILAAIIEYYIETGNPVGSKMLADMLGNHVSSATIRNDMAALTAAGYLEQPHTSAGRLPTAKAFRLYIEQLMDRRPLSEKDRLSIDEMLAGAGGDPAQLLQDASRALAEATGFAAVAAKPEQNDSAIRRIDIMQMSPRSMAVVLVSASGSLRTRMCRCQRDIPSAVTLALSDYLSRKFLDRPLSCITVDAMQEILLELGEAGLAVAPILSTFYELAQDCAASQVMLSGQLNLLRHPDYELDSARSLIGFLSEQERLRDVLAQQNEGLQVVLGGDSLPELTGSSLIVTHYSLGMRGQGTIGIIGPVRMNYAETIPRIEYFANAIGKLLSELFDEE